ncbi:hypothetical protein Fot_29767 [Forsythia ovata]|uniref:Uncharacterized protein n=1 Tax=Forsythia ovata TaxID=205694 RepID=A0ABD1TSV4_9LAMI
MAKEAHCSAGGFSFQCHHLYGRIEDNVKKLCTQHEKPFKESQKQNSVKNYVVSPSPYPSPMVNNRIRIVGLVDEEHEENESERKIRRGAIRKLGNDFKMVAHKCGMGRKTGTPA